MDPQPINSDNDSDYEPDEEDGDTSTDGSDDA